MNYKKNIYIVNLIFCLFISTNSHADDIFSKGKDIFLNNGNCATCHTLSEAKSIATIGPNLDKIRPEKKRVITVVSNGIGVMPAYQDVLSLEEIEAVAHYVSKASDK